jgi:hypothetical protein
MGGAQRREYSLPTLHALRIRNTSVCPTRYRSWFCTAVHAAAHPLLQVVP